jgi:hypothetical protein
MSQLIQNDTARNSRELIQRYLAKRQLYPLQIVDKPSSGLGICVVIPVFSEPDIVQTLGSLADCAATDCDVEVLLVMNFPETADKQSREEHETGRQKACHWIEQNSDSKASFLLLEYSDLPEKTAGVGVARKLGMDEAAARLASSGSGDGIVVSLDADCEVRSDYLTSIEQHFRLHENCPGVSIAFEHRIDEMPDTQLAAALCQYELHLRYYVAGLRMAGMPSAFHTIGSAMAFRASRYAQQGGMNSRKGGEDFYFIQKLVKVGSYQNLSSTVVYPGSRLSNRVPFGTGPALQRLMDSDEMLMTYSPQVFDDLAGFCGRAAEMFSEAPQNTARFLAPALQSFLYSQDWESTIDEIKSNVASRTAFTKRLFAWFDGFRIMKYANFSVKEAYGELPVTAAAAELLATLNQQLVSDQSDCRALLECYRELDRPC